MKQSITLLFSHLLFISLFIPGIADAQPICNLQHLPAPGNREANAVTGILQDSKGFIWFATREGLSRFDGYAFKNYPINPEAGNGTADNHPVQLAQTQARDIWCRTADSRIYLFDTRQEKFIDLLRPYEAEKLQKPDVQDIYTLPKGISWVVCRRGAFRIDEQACKTPEGTGVTFYSTEGGKLKGNRITTVFQDSEGDEWVLTDRGVSIIGRKKIESDIPFRQILEDNGRIYLVSPHNQLVIYLPRTQQLQFHDMPFPTSNDIHALRKLGTDSIGLCTNEGLYIYLAEIHRYRLVDPCTPNGPSSRILSVFKDRSGELWLHPDTAGVVRYNPDTDEKEYYLTPAEECPLSGTPNRDFVFEDRQGTLWVVPREGCLSYYDRENKQLKTFHTSGSSPDSLLTPVIQHPFLDRQGNLWSYHDREINKLSFPAPAHLVPTVAADATENDAYLPPIVFTGLQIGEELREANIDAWEELRLKPSERDVAIRFAALDYAAPESVSYTYRLKGLEEKWHKADSNRWACYTHLPAGEYELQVRAANSNGTWAESTRMLPVIVSPTFWESRWAWVLYAVLFVAVVVIVRFTRRKR